MSFYNVFAHGMTPRSPTPLPSYTFDARSEVAPAWNAAVRPTKESNMQPENIADAIAGEQMTDQERADLIRTSVLSMLSALKALGVSNDAQICLTAIGTLMGVMARASEHPERAMAGMNAIARGILDGSLLDD